MKAKVKPNLRTEMTYIITSVGRKQIELRPYKNYTIPLMPSSYHVDLLNITQKRGYIPPIELIEKEPSINAKTARISQYEKVLLNGGLLVGDRRKGGVKIFENSYLDKLVSGTLLVLSNIEERGEKNLVHSNYSESEVADLAARFREETGIKQEMINLQLDILRRKGYLIEDEGFLVVNQEKWIREKLVLKELNEKGLEKYDLPSKYVYSVQLPFPLFQNIKHDILEDKQRAREEIRREHKQLLETAKRIEALSEEERVCLSLFAVRGRVVMDLWHFYDKYGHECDKMLLKELIDKGPRVDTGETLKSVFSYMAKISNLDDLHSVKKILAEGVMKIKEKYKS